MPPHRARQAARAGLRDRVRANPRGDARRHARHRPAGLRTSTSTTTSRRSDALTNGTDSEPPDGGLAAGAARSVRTRSCRRTSPKAPTRRRNQRFRNPDDCFDCAGLAFQIDATSPETSILREPLFARGPAVTCPSTIRLRRAVLRRRPSLAPPPPSRARRNRRCSCAPRSRASSRRRARRRSSPGAFCARFHDQSAPPPLHPLDYRFAVAICVLLHVLYPYKQGNREPIVRWAYAYAAGASRKHPECNLLALERARRASGDEREANAISEASRWWWPLCARAQRRVGRDRAAARALLERDGSFDNSLADIDAMANDLETAARGVWCVHSADGCARQRRRILEGVLTPRRTSSPAT